jgi:hypothetical protein
MDRRRMESEVAVLLSLYPENTRMFQIIQLVQRDLRCSINRAVFWIAANLVDYFLYGRKKPAQEELLEYSPKMKTFETSEDLVDHYFEDGYPSDDLPFREKMTAASTYVDGEMVLISRIKLFLTSDLKFFKFDPSKKCGDNLDEAFNHIKFGTYGTDPPKKQPKKSDRSERDRYLEQNYYGQAREYPW